LLYFSLSSSNPSYFRFWILHSLSSSFISSFLLRSSPSSFFLHALLSSLVFSSIHVSISSYLLLPHVLHILLTSFLNLSLQFFSIPSFHSSLSFIDHHHGTISIHTLLSGAPHLNLDPEIENPDFSSAICKFHP